VTAAAALESGASTTGHLNLQTLERQTSGHVIGDLQPPMSKTAQALANARFTST
jgi:hypothetical protein